MNTVKNFINKVEGKLSKHLFTIGYGGTSAIILSNTMRTFCEIDANATTTGFMKMLFNVTMFLGILLIAVGVFLAIKGMTNQEDQSSQQNINKGVALFISGVVLAALKTIIKTITGVDPTTMKIF